MSSALPEFKAHVLPDTLSAQVQHPVIIKRPRLPVGFASHDHKLHSGQIGFNADPLDQGLANDVLCRIGSSENRERRSSALFWFSTVQPTVTLPYPSPQSSGTHCANLSIRLVRKRKFRSGRLRIIAQHSPRHGSASSIRKSVEKQKIYRLSRLHFIIPVFIPFGGRPKLFRAHDALRVYAAFSIALMDIAKPAALAVPMAAAPRVPHCHRLFSLRPKARRILRLCAASRMLAARPASP